MARAVRAGEFDERIELWEPREEQDARGQTKTVYRPWKSRYASVESISGYESVRAQQVGLAVTHRVRLRLLPGLTSGHRVVYREFFFDIVGMQEVDGRQVHELICEQTNDKVMS